MKGRKRYNGTPAERFERRVIRSPDPDGCWEYDGHRHRGYGKFGVSDSQSVLAHRFAYELWVGPIPEGAVLHHRCENPACVRPDHLEPKANGQHLREHCLERGVVRNQYGTFTVTRTVEEKRIRDRDWMRAKRARLRAGSREEGAADG